MFIPILNWFRLNNYTDMYMYCMYFEQLVLRTIQVVTKSFVNNHSEILDGQQIFFLISQMGRANFKGDSF